MTTYNIALIPGDGIGHEVVPEGVRVLEEAGRKFGFNFKWDEFPWSCEYYAKHGESMYCGFAWVYFPSARTQFVNWCKKNDVGSKHWQKGWQIWNPTGTGTQSMDIKEAGSHAFAEVLKSYGIECRAQSRAD